MWFAFTGAAAPGAAPAGSVQIRCVQTNELFTVGLTGNTVARPTTGVVFSLDKSGSMQLPAGTGGTRMQLLHEASARCVELMRDGSGAGVVSFDHDAYPGIGLLPFAPASSHRGDVLGVVNGLAPGGATSIGDGVELARTTLTTGAASFDGHAVVVLTDGLENQPKSISQVSGSIDARTFAIGLGTAQQVSTSALNALTKGTGGYLLLTGPLTPHTGSYFLLSKYFQQILVTATSENIVTDPSGFIGPGAPVRVPFDLADTDIDVTVVLLVDLPAVELALEAPDGSLVTEADLAALGAEVVRGTNMTYARVALPLPIGAGAHGGTWNAVLELDRPRFKRALTSLGRAVERGSASAKDLERLTAHGVRWSVTVSSWSNVRFDARVTQASVEPGAALHLGATLTEHGLPVAGRARVSADVVRPDGVPLAVDLVEEANGSFAATIAAAIEGVWRVRFLARGRTYGGSPFTREQLASAAIVLGGDRLPPEPPDADPIRGLLECLLRDRKWREWLRERGLDSDRLAECLERSAQPLDDKELQMLG
jgi:hypothetical protein